jgi:haloacid dehalogenase-like hydrolase
MPEGPVAEKRKISLVLADVDGTLVTEEKVLTKRAQNAVGALQSAGIRFAITSGRPPRIITCSALKRSYRQTIIGDRPQVRLVYPRGGRELIAEHLAGRHGHFMPAALLRSQIDTLEEPDPSEDPLTVEVGPPAAQVADEIIRLLGASATVVQGVLAHPN